MKAELFDLFTGPEVIDVKFDKFLTKRLAEKRIPKDFVLPLHRCKPKHGERVLVLNWGELVDAVYYDIGSSGYFEFQDYQNRKSFHKVEGWIREEELP